MSARSEIYELLIEQYLTCDGKVFVAPQYDIAWNAEANMGGRRPDFVAIDTSRNPNEIVVVEVVSSNAIHQFLNRMENREVDWFSPLKSAFNLHCRALIFVRHACMESANNWCKERGIQTDEVRFFEIEEATIYWKYIGDRRENGLPR